MDNNLLGSAVRAGEKALASCVKNATCRSGMEQMGIATGLTNAQTEEAMKAGVTRDPEVISKLSPAQIEYLDNQIRSGKGMADIMLGKETWGERLVPSHTGSNERPETGPNNTGNTETPDAVPNHTGNSEYTETGASHTGNTSDKPDTGGNTKVTPIPEGPNKDDLAYQSSGDKPANLSPEGSARAGAFNEAKRQSGIPVSQSPGKVSPNVDKRGNPQPGYIYEFDVPKPGGGTQKIYIRDDAGGHFYGDDASQNRGSHFNDEKGNHYDY